MIAIPFDAEKSADQEIRFVGAGPSITLRFTWNTFSDAWFCAIGDAGARRLVPRFIITKSCAGLIGVPGGFMMKKATANAPATIGYYDLGKTWVLCYLTPAEVEKWEHDNGLG